MGFGVPQAKNFRADVLK